MQELELKARAAAAPRPPAAPAEVETLDAGSLFLGPGAAAATRPPAAAMAGMEMSLEYMAADVHSRRQISPGTSSIHDWSFE